MFENPRRGRQARSYTTNAPKILDLKSSSEQIFSRKLPLGAPVCISIKILYLIQILKKLWNEEIFFSNNSNSNLLLSIAIANIAITPFAVHYEKIRIHLRKTATNSAKIHSLARKSEHLRINQIQ